MSSRELLSTERPAGIHQASRADQRVVRQILANLVEGEFSSEVERIAAGPLSRIIRFMAGCRLTFVFVGWDEQRQLHAYGSPSAELVALLVEDLLGHCSTGKFGGFEVSVDRDHLPPSTVDNFRSTWVEAAVNQIADGLRDRDIPFIFGWQIPSDCSIRLDRSLGTDREKVAYYLHWFLRERLGISATAYNQKPATTAVEI